MSASSNFISPPLTADDCVQLNLYHAQEKPGMKRKEVSWIWRDKRYQGEKANKYTSEGTLLQFCAASESALIMYRFYLYYHRWWTARSSVSPGGTWSEKGAAAYAAR